MCHFVHAQLGHRGFTTTMFTVSASHDDHALLKISSSQAINSAQHKNAGFDPVKHFNPVSLIGDVLNVLLALARSKPGFYQYASADNCTLNHLLGEMLNTMACISLQHVPYKSVAPALNDLLGGQFCDPLVRTARCASADRGRGRLQRHAVGRPVCPRWHAARHGADGGR